MEYVLTCEQVRFIALEFASNFVLSIGAIVFLIAVQRHGDAQVVAVTEEFGVGTAASPARVAEGGERRGMVRNPAGGDDFRGHEGIACRHREREQQQRPHCEDAAPEPK